MSRSRAIFRGSIALGAVLCLGATGAAAKLISGEGISLPAPRASGVELAAVACRLTGQWIAGDEKTCYYNCGGERQTEKVKSGDLCPEHITKQ